MHERRALRISVDERVLERHTDYVAVVVRADGLTNGPPDARGAQRLAAAEASLRARGMSRMADDPHIAAWRAAFGAFGAKPSKYRCSAEALGARVLKGQPLPQINRLVDLYNAVSVEHVVPAGGEDLDALDGGLHLTFATGTEVFDARDHVETVERAAPGEVVWRDDTAVTCRRWNWRQGRRTQLTDSTTSAFFILDALGDAGSERLDGAAQALEAGLRDECPKATLRRLRLDVSSPDAAA
jgi:DNA/RNA-binding domain of Phe-tRNA-synthetase-like protein